MRNTFAAEVVLQCNKDNTFFLTGDLGFMALEEVRSAFGDRFVNAGIAEQNMIGVAAGLAKEGNKVFTYSIAPFCYARPFEQIRNDLCFANLPVCIVGNGGGYAYGHMGPTHHALEDCAVMSAIGVRVLVPAFDEDIAFMLKELISPTYLRLGYDVRPKNTELPEYASWRNILEGGEGVIVALGPLAGVAWEAFIDYPVDKRPSIWAVTELTIEHIPNEFWAEVAGKNLFVIEEHVVKGGLGMNLAFAMLQKDINISGFIHRHALGYPSGRFGSQAFHRAQCGLDVDGLHSMIKGRS